MAKVYEVLFMFNYPHPSGDRQRDIFFTKREAARVPEIAPDDLERYKALGYIREIEMPEAQHARYVESQTDVVVPVRPEEMTAPRVGPGALPRPLGKQGQKLVRRMQATFEGDEARSSLLARAAAEDEAGASEVEVPDSTTPRRRSTSR